ncbi:cytosolic phospholipase A2 zeta-like isoform X1 [Gadus chalcogrammus]|uniref:cytosolic phospholipase A2 zeta-like isoform X1 n=1 Tax=Gadus chalcogrammus TaxID=1042646 RepID=UPI0024C3255C|nr:cytosolic phospholipase A2 zeta-like isoform X1 [Gadus chalcogrammus]
MVSCRGRAAVLACFVCVSLRGLLAQPVNATAEPSPETSAKQLVRGPSKALSPGEAEFIRQRKEVVLASLGRLNISSTADSVPHIALLGSGGGQRAAVALLGSLQQMGQDDLLDPLLYMGGVSGSTWTMALLYSDPQWSVNKEQVFSSVGVHGDKPWWSLFTGPYWWLRAKSKDEDFSLSEIWGLLTSYLFMNHMDQRLLSDEASRGSTNPYPVYSAIEKECFNTNTTEAVWFEFTPHEAGFPELGLFVSTAYLGSGFEGEELKERKPEMDMVQLLGIVGSAFANEDSIAEIAPPWMNMSTAGTALKAHLRIHFTLTILVDMLDSGITNVTDLAKVEDLQKRVSDILLEEVPLHNLTTEEQVEELQRKNLALFGSVQTWVAELDNGVYKVAVADLMEKVLPLLIKWQWGTTENFLYAVKDSEVPDCLQSRVLNLIDGGIAINVPYESFLGKKRDVDLLIAAEFSAGEMFETLTLARDYAAAVGKPFPVIDEQVLLDKDWPKDFYVFPGENDQPTIVFMPLFNRINCKDEAEVKARMVEYSTFQRPFSPEKVAALQEIARDNMRNNKDAIVREIQNAATRRQARRNVTDSAL